MATKPRETRSFGYRFGNRIYQSLGRSDKLERDIISEEWQSYEVSMPVNHRENRLDLLNAQQKIQKYLYRDSPSDVNNILLELFSNRSEDATKRFLSLKPTEFMAFVINNYKLLRDVAKNADAAGLFNKQLSLEYGIIHDELDLVPFELPKNEMYRRLQNEGKKVFTKIFIKDIGKVTGLTHQNPKKLLKNGWRIPNRLSGGIAVRIEETNTFLLPMDKRKKVFPDYIFKGIDGLTYIIETRGK